MHAAIAPLPGLVAELAALAGYHYAPERCVLLAPQLVFIIHQANQLRAMDLAGLEPVGIFRPGEAQRRAGGGEGERHG